MASTDIEARPGEVLPEIDVEAGVFETEEDDPKDGAGGEARPGSVVVASKMNEDFRLALRKHLVVEEQINPFAYQGHWTPWEFVKLILGIAVIPVRLFFAGSTIVLVFLFAKAATSFGYDDSKPLKGCRRVMLWPLRPLCRAFIFFFGVYWISVKGKKARKGEATVAVLAPHSTFLDTMTYYAVYGRWSGMGKKEVTKTPLFGTIFRGLQLIAVDREDPNGRKKALEAFVDRARNNEGWPQLAVFPEGTCTNRRSLIQFKRGPFVPGVPVQPVVLRWPWRFFDPSWTSSGPNRIALVFRLMTQIYTRVEVEFLPVYTPNEEEKEDPELFAQNVRQVMAEALGVPTTEHSYEDAFLSVSAKKSKFHPDQIVDFEFAQVKELLHLDLKEARRLLKRFGADPKVRKSGKMDAKQFAKALDLPLTDAIIELFNLLDSDGLGLIDYKTFLIGLTFISQNTTTDEAIDLLYQALDPDNTGSISQASLRSVLASVFRKVDRRTVSRLLKAADKAGTGRIDREQFKAFLERNPEMLVAGLEIREAFGEQGHVLDIRKRAPVSPASEI